MAGSTQECLQTLALQNQLLAHAMLLAEGHFMDASQKKKKIPFKKLKLGVSCQLLYALLDDGDA